MKRERKKVSRNGGKDKATEKLKESKIKRIHGKLSKKRKKEMEMERKTKLRK